ncbi:hypothetical protein C8D82_1569 [Victivallis vadensis]|uniref:Uncharacterized protein n=1 Tax=Victivallis vadensis TaxID=172901 RepID=A0A2U1AB82_9BACT|nr:hypothetical protein C8D82_1569 [Victivallis vadensis]
MTKPNVVSEAPPGVARNAGVEGVGRRRRTSKRRSRARERKCFAIGPAPATGEGVRGTCATSPGAIRRPEVRRSLPSGHPACSCAQKLLPSGHLARSCCNAKFRYKTYARFESGDQSPHSKAAARHYRHCTHGLPPARNEKIAGLMEFPVLNGYCKEKTSTHPECPGAENDDAIDRTDPATAGN